MSGYEHDGPCIYCEHGPCCIACPPGPVEGHVCRACHERITSREVADDPYYRGDFLEMFGDDE